MLLLKKAIQYAEDVVEGKETTTWEVKVQCKIFLDDYNNRQHEDKFKFYFDTDKIIIINNLLKLFNFATGFVAGKQVLKHLANFQCFFIANIFGWRFKNRPEKFRYDDNTLFIARKNAKTALIGLVFILLMLTSQKFSEFYSICLTKELAAEIKKSMEQIIKSSPLINKHFKVSLTKTGRITCKLTDCFFEPRVSEAGKNNSIRSEAFVSDEHANFKEKSNFNAMKSGQKNVVNGLVFRTTTAYAIDDSVMEEDLAYIRGVLKGVIKNERQFALIYYADKENLWNDKGMYQANPLRIEENYETIRENREVVKDKTSEQEEYLTKEMNHFVAENEINKYLNIDYWKKLKISDKEFRKKIKGKKVKVSVDMSVTTDLTAVGIEFEDEELVYCHSKGFLPEDSLATRREKHIDYRKYEKLGYCDIHEGMTVNYTLVEEYIRNIEEEYDCTIDCIVTDPTNAKEMMERLAEDYDVLMLRQTYTNLSPATKEFRKKVYDAEVRYVENELLDWNMLNAITTKGKADDEMLQKENKNKQRIDMVVVLIFAYADLLNGDSSYDPMKALENTDW